MSVIWFTRISSCCHELIVRKKSTESVFRTWNVRCLYVKLYYFCYGIFFMDLYWCVHTDYLYWYFVDLICKYDLWWNKKNKILVIKCFLLLKKIVPDQLMFFSNKELILWNSLPIWHHRIETLWHRFSFVMSYLIY